MDTVTAVGTHYKFHAQGNEEAKSNAVYFAVYHATHVGEGGPVVLTQKTTRSQFVHVLRMDSNNNAAHVVKAWEATWVLRELGWM